MKKFKVMVMCGLLIGCVGMFAACGANDKKTDNTQNNAVTDTMDNGANNGTNTDNGTNESSMDKNNTNKNDTNKNNADKNNTNGSNVKNDVENLGEDVVDGVEDAGDAIADGVDDVVDGNQNTGNHNGAGN